MKKIMLIVACGMALASCGEKFEEMKKAAEGMEQLAKAGEQIEKQAGEANELYKQRAAKGDTVAMPYAELQKFLPSSVSGFALEGEPSGAQQSMGEFSMSTTEQKWVAGNAAEATAPRVSVSIMDCGGTESGFGIVGAGLSLAGLMSSEDANQKVGPVKIDLPYTSAMSTFDKINKTTTVMVGTRNRYLITLTATGGTSDQTAQLTDVAKEIAKKFENK